MLHIHNRLHRRRPRSGRITRAVAAVGLAAACAGCSTSTTATDVWKNPRYAGGPVTNVIVFGGRMNETNRHNVEDAFVRSLLARGVRATASYTVFPGPLPSEQIAQQTVQSGAYDGVLVTTMRGVTERVTIEAGVGYPGAFWGGYYGPYWGSTWEPAYSYTDTFVKFETSLWDPHGGGKMIWSEVTQTENPSSAADFIQSLLNHVVPDMAKAGLLPQMPGAPVSQVQHPMGPRAAEASAR